MTMQMAPTPVSETSAGVRGWRSSKSRAALSDRIVALSRWMRRLDVQTRLSWCIKRRLGYQTASGDEQKMKGKTKRRRKSRPRVFYLVILFIYFFNCKWWTTFGRKDRVEEEEEEGGWYRISLVFLYRSLYRVRVCVCVKRSAIERIRERHICIFTHITSHCLIVLPFRYSSGRIPATGCYPYDPSG